MSPRRSSRARATQTTNNVHHTQSSASSTSSGRAERQTRSYNKASSPQKPANSRSLSPDAPMNPPRKSRADHRKRKRNAKDDNDDDDEEDDANEPNDAPSDVAADQATDQAGTEEEVTRCVCGLTDYPGPPPSEKWGARGESRSPSPKDSADPPKDDEGSLFIQCDICQVWQHGGCVGVRQIRSEEAYSCERCRPDLHEIITGYQGYVSFV